MRHMRCTACRSTIRLSHRPGIFLALAVTAVCAALVAGFTFRSVTGLVLGGGLGFVAFLALGGTWTQMVDASTWVYSKQKRQGVECDRCGHVNRIYPWSV